MAIRTDGRRARTFLSTLGRQNLHGLKGRVAGPVAGAVSRRTRLSEEQVRALIGLGLLALSLYGIASVLRRAARAA